MEAVVVGENAVSCIEESEEEDGENVMTKEKVKLTFGHLMTVDAEGLTTITGKLDEAGVLLPCSHALVALKHDLDFCNIPEIKEYPCGHNLIITCSESQIYAQELAECLFPCEWTMCSRNLHLQEPCGNAHNCGDRTQCPPCQEEVRYSLPGCNHVVKRLCFENGPEDDYICKEPCKRKLDGCLHACLKLCGEECDICVRMMPGRVPGCPLDHFTCVLCFVRHDFEALSKMKCAELCEPRNIKPKCGHSVKVFCYEADKVTTKELARRCEAPCNGVLEGCDHKCTGTCRDCFTFRFHKRCEEKCSRTLICNHSPCSSPCGEGCSPCPRNCPRMCPHKSCQLECGIPCEWRCAEQCVYGCRHGHCTRQCDQICDKKPCQEPCSKKLDCTHDCVGFCGEPCPPLCRYCNKDKLSAGALYTLGEVGEHDRFIYLDACGHCVESEAMDGWMEAEPENGEIVVKMCPICRTRLNWMHRYSEILHSNWNAVELVKKSIFGDENKIEECLRGIEVRVSQEYETVNELGAHVEIFQPGFLKCIKDKIDRDESLGCRRVDMHWEAVRFIGWMLDEWSNAGREVAKYNESRRLHPDLEDVALLWNQLFEFVAKRNWPFRTPELKAFSREKQRLVDYGALFTTLQTAHDLNVETFTTTFWSASCQKTFGHILDALKIMQGYSPRYQERFQLELQRLKIKLNVTLAITEKEKSEIVEAFGGTQSGTGRWFKCKNGHVYVITECAGAIMEGQCPECKERIGGDTSSRSRG